MTKKEIFDFSDHESLTQKGIRSCRSFEIKDGDQSIVGFYDHPDEMWISEAFKKFALQCEWKGRLTIEARD